MAHSCTIHTPRGSFRACHPSWEGYIQFVEEEKGGLGGKSSADPRGNVPNHPPLWLAHCESTEGSFEEEEDQRDEE